jgi:hypothetical protein
VIPVETYATVPATAPAATPVAAPVIVSAVTPVVAPAVTPTPDTESPQASASAVSTTYAPEQTQQPVYTPAQMSERVSGAESLHAPTPARASDTWRCYRCQSENPSDASFCRQCGAPHS